MTWLIKLAQISSFTIASSAAVATTAYVVLYKKASYLSTLENKDAAFIANIKSKEAFIIEKNSLQTTQQTAFDSADKEYKDEYNTQSSTTDTDVNTFFPADVLNEMLLQRTKERDSSFLKLKLANQFFDKSKLLISTFEKNLPSTKTIPTPNPQQIQIYKDFEQQIKDKREQERNSSIFSLLVPGVKNIQDEQETKFAQLNKKSIAKTNTFNALEATKELIKRSEEELKVLKKNQKDNEQELLKYKPKAKAKAKVIESKKSSDSSTN